ncbi:molybdenum ABC transporter permease [bacterium]|nr:molybdenum ABC transporter permease [bacterium]
MRNRALVFLLGCVAFAVAGYMWQSPRTLRTFTLYALILLINIFYLYNVVFHLSARSRRMAVAAAVWYVALVVLFMAVSTGPRGTAWRFGGDHRRMIFGLFVLVTGAFFHIPAIFGFLVIALVAYFVMPFYAEAVLAVLGVSYLLFLGEFRCARETQNRVPLVCLGLGFVLLLMVLFPLVHLATQRSPQDLKAILQGSGDRSGGGGAEPTQLDLVPEETRQAIWVSLKSATVATVIVLVFGVPLAYFLVRSTFPGRRVLDVLVDLPIVLPPPVAGLALIFLLGREPGIGTWLRNTFGLQLVDDWRGIVLAQVFVSCPFLIRSAMASFRAVDERLENVSRSLGAGPWRTFFRVTLPLSARGIFMGCILTWGRAIGEFGSVVILAKTPKSMPVHIYDMFYNSGPKGESLSVAIVMIILCVTVFAVLHLVASRTLWRNIRTIWSGFGDTRRESEHAAR